MHFGLYHYGAVVHYGDHTRRGRQAATRSKQMTGYLCFDNAGGILLWIGRHGHGSRGPAVYAHLYSDGAQAGTDIVEWMSTGSTSSWDGHDEALAPRAVLDEYDRPECARIELDCRANVADVAMRILRVGGRSEEQCARKILQSCGESAEARQMLSELDQDEIPDVDTSKAREVESDNVIVTLTKERMSVRLAEDDDRGNIHREAQRILKRD